MLNDLHLCSFISFELPGFCECLWVMGLCCREGWASLSEIDEVCRMHICVRGMRCAACDVHWMHRSGEDGLQSPGAGSPGLEKGQYKFHFNIGSIDSFERKMEEAQEDLGWGTDAFVPITYTNELSWQQVFHCFSKLSQPPDFL